MRGDFLKLDDRAQRFCSAVQFLFSVRKLSSLAESITFDDAENNDLDRNEAVSGLEMKNLVRVTELQNLD